MLAIVLITFSTETIKAEQYCLDEEEQIKIANALDELEELKEEVNSLESINEELINQIHSEREAAGEVIKSKDKRIENLNKIIAEKREVINRYEEKSDLYNQEIIRLERNNKIQNALFFIAGLSVGIL